MFVLNNHPVAFERHHKTISNELLRLTVHKHHKKAKKKKRMDMEFDCSRRLAKIHLMAMARYTIHSCYTLCYMLHAFKREKKIEYPQLNSRFPKIYAFHC